MSLVDTFQPATGPRLSEQVYQALLESILSGSLLPGEVVSELALAKRLKVSRTPVHDALRQLIKDGLVHQQPNRRAVIAEFTADDIREVFEMRRLLEGEAAALAARRLDRPTLHRLRKVALDLDAEWGGPGWVEKWADCDDEFHSVIARSCGSRRLCQDVLRYRTIHRGFNRTHTSAEVVHTALAEHLRILDALDQRDADAARAAMAAHISEWENYFIQTLIRS